MFNSIKSLRCFKNKTKIQFHHEVEFEKLLGIKIFVNFTSRNEKNNEKRYFESFEFQDLVKFYFTDSSFVEVKIRFRSNFTHDA